MVSLFRKALCYVIVAQMVLTPLYGASAAVAPTTVMVSDTLTQTLLGKQMGMLIGMNSKLMTLNKLQTETNTKLDFILKAIKYIPPETKESFPSTDNVLLEFSSSLYGAYTENSTIYKTLWDAAKIGQERFKDAPRAGPVGNEGAADRLNTPSPAPSNGTQAPAFDSTKWNLPSQPNINYDDAFKAPVDPSLGYNENLFKNNPTALQNIANFTGQVAALGKKLGDTYNAFAGLQKSCQGGGMNCAQSGLNFLTNLPDVLRKFGIALSPEFTNNIKQIGQIGGAIVSLVGTFDGKGFDVRQITQYARAVQGFLVASSLAKRGFILPSELTESAGSLESTFYNLAGLFGLPGLKAMERTAVPNVLAQLGNLAGTVKDSFQTGPLSKDTPLKGSPNSKTLSPETMARILAAINQCPPDIGLTQAQCQRIIGENQRFFLGRLKANCAATAISQQRIPAALFQELFTGAGNSERCQRVQLYDTKGGKELCPSIGLLQASSLAEGAVSSQLNVLIGLSMYNLVMTNVNTEQVIWQNACASMGDVIEKGITFTDSPKD